MTWIKLGDEFADDADAARLSDAAVRTHLDALAWSNRRLLDLRVPKRDLPRFAFSPDGEAAAKELEAAEWWVDEGDTWLLAYHAEWQQSRDDVEEQRKLARDRQDRSRRHRKGDHSECIRGRYCPDGHVTRDNTRDIQRESRHPDPSRPAPKESGKGRGPRAAAGAAPTVPLSREARAHLDRLIQHYDRNPGLRRDDWAHAGSIIADRDEGELPTHGWTVPGCIAAVDRFIAERIAGDKRQSVREAVWMTLSYASLTPDLASPAEFAEHFAASVAETADNETADEPSPTTAEAMTA